MAGTKKAEVKRRGEGWPLKGSQTKGSRSREQGELSILRRYKNTYLCLY